MQYSPGRISNSTQPSLTNGLLIFCIILTLLLLAQSFYTFEKLEKIEDRVLRLSNNIELAETRYAKIGVNEEMAKRTLEAIAQNEAKKEKIKSTDPEKLEPVIFPPAQPPKVNIENGIFLISKTELEMALSNSAQVLSSVRAVPFYKNGDIVGVRIFSIREDSLFDVLDFNNSDVVTRFTNDKVVSPNQVLRMFNRLLEVKKMDVFILRHGEKKTIKLRVQD